MLITDADVLSGHCHRCQQVEGRRRRCSSHSAPLTSSQTPLRAPAAPLSLSSRVLTAPDHYRPVPADYRPTLLRLLLPAIGSPVVAWVLLLLSADCLPPPPSPQKKDPPPPSKKKGVKNSDQDPEGGKATRAVRGSHHNVRPQKRVQWWRDRGCGWDQNWED